MMGDHPTPPSSPHRCKVCFKSFPCGRSLGGHMRSHVSTVAAAAAGDERAQSSYGLRENPKKTWRVSGSGYGDGKKCCAECGKEFLTWRALFGHMKCHPVRSQPLGYKPAWEKEELEKQSDHKITLSVPHRKKRTMRLPVAAFCSLSGSDDERGEDGAISLMMLSRGSRYWNIGSGGSSESSVKNSTVLEDAKGSELDDARNEFKKTDSDASNDLDGFGDCVEELGKSCAEDNDLNSRAAAEMGIESPPIKIDLEVIESSEADESKSLADHVVGFRCNVPNPNAGEKRRRFECAACKKTFKSYQALGGHRASHKRMKCCPGSSTNTIDSSTDPIATEQSAADRRDVSELSSFVLAKKNKEHECLICGKVYSSGQALGGHKRCHLFKSPDGEGNAASDAMLQQQPPKLVDLFDLNLPATAGGDGDFDSINSEENSESESWWIGGSVKQEGVQIGVISN